MEQMSVTDSAFIGFESTAGPMHVATKALPGLSRPGACSYEAFGNLEAAVFEPLEFHGLQAAAGGRA